jgi:hypothetical protein
LEEVSLPDFMFAVVAVRLVVVEVDLPEKSIGGLVLAIDLSWYREALKMLGVVGLRFLRAELEVQTYFFSWCLSSRTIMAVASASLD